MDISLNRVQIIGRLTRAPELKHTPGGASVVELRMAANRSFTKKDGSRQESVTYLTVKAWNRTAENVCRYLTVGSRVLVEGSLESREWDTQNGEHHSVLEVVAERVQFLDPLALKVAREDVVPF